MFIVDSQVHIWGADTPQRPWPQRQAPHRPEPLGHVELLSAMDAAGVARTVLVPPGGEGERNDLALAAVQQHPDRFAIMGRLDPEDPQAAAKLATWKAQPGMYGIRLTFHTEWQLPLLTEGKLDWLWPVAERHGVRLMILAPHALLHLIDGIAQRHPALQIALDHLSIPTKTRDDEAFAGLDKLLALAPRANISVKASGLPCYSSQSYPYPALHPHIRRVYDAFGPRRLFWGTDYTRMPCTYQQAIALFTEELPWLTPDDKEWIMGRGICEWLGWPLP